MEQNKYDILDLLASIVDEKPVDTQAVVNQMMLNKAHDAIAAYDAEFNKAIFNDEPQEIEDVPEDEPEETEDDVDLDSNELLNTLNSQEEPKTD